MDLLDADIKIFWTGYPDLAKKNYFRSLKFSPYFSIQIQIHFYVLIFFKKLLNFMIIIILFIVIIILNKKLKLKIIIESKYSSDIRFFLRIFEIQISRVFGYEYR